MKPETIGRKLDPEKQKAFIEAYENLLNSAGPDEAVLFVDAAHPTHAARPVGCWAPAKDSLAIEQTCGRRRLNVHGAIDSRDMRGVMHKHLTHNTRHASYREFAEAALGCLRQHVPRRWPEFRDSVTDNFRVIDPKDFRVLT